MLENGKVCCIGETLLLLALSYFLDPSIFYRLLDNAVKFSDSGKSIYISLQVQQEDDKHFVVVRVLDEGKGMSNTEGIFDPFAQGDSQVSRTNSGGLGWSWTIRRSFMIEAQWHSQVSV